MAMFAFIRKHPLPIGLGAIVTLAGLAWLAFAYFGVHTLFIDDEVSEAVPTFDAPAEPAELTSATPAPTVPPADAPAVSTPDAAPDEESISAVPSPADAATEPPATTAPAAPAATEAPEETTPAAPDEITTEYSGTFVGDAHPTSGTAVVLGNGTGQRFLRFEDFETDNGPDLNVYLVNSSTGDVSDFVDLGDLKGNIGEQNYEIPERIDLDVYDQVVIWCVRFGVGFGDAELMAV